MERLFPLWIRMILMHEQAPIMYICSLSCCQMVVLMEEAMFLVPTPQVLQKMITDLDELYEHDISNLDTQGDLYEYMLGKLASAGQNGQSAIHWDG